MTDSTGSPTVALTGLIVRPGDTLLLTTSTKLSMSELDGYCAALQAHLPEVRVVILDCIEGMAAYRPDTH